MFEQVKNLRRTEYFLWGAHIFVYLATYLAIAPPQIWGWVLVNVAFAGALIWASVVDIASFRIPNFISASLAAYGLLITYVRIPDQLFIHIIVAIMIFLFFVFLDWAYLFLRGVHGLGMGDAKLIGAGLLWVGPLALPKILLIASLGGIAYILLSKKNMHRKIPFGPFLAIAIWWAWVSL